MQESGYHYFETEIERSKYLESHRKLESDLGANMLAYSMMEGYHTRSEVVAHRICRYKGEEYHSTYVFPPYYPYSTAEYHIENKWYLGFNDYPLGEANCNESDERSE